MGRSQETEALFSWGSLSSGSKQGAPGQTLSHMATLPLSPPFPNVSDTLSCPPVPAAVLLAHSIDAKLHSLSYIFLTAGAQG